MYIILYESKSELKNQLFLTCDLYDNVGITIDLEFSIYITTSN